MIKFTEISRYCRACHHSRRSKLAFRRPVCLIDDRFPRHSEWSGLVQLVNGPRLRVGHTLDVDTARTDTAIGVVVAPSIISDHSLVTSQFFFGSCEESRIRTTVSKRREWKALNVDASRIDLNTSTLYVNSPEDVSALFDAYDQTLRSLLDKHVLTKKVWSGAALRLRGLTTAAGTRKSLQDDLNGDTAAQITRTTIVQGASSSIDCFPAGARVLKDYRQPPRLQVALAED